MLGVSRWETNSTSTFRFQYSIGDAFCDTVNLQVAAGAVLSILHWRCGWRRCSTGPCRSSPSSFNTPLEMLDILLYLEQSNSGKLSILHWRCLENGKIALPRVSPRLSILHWKCATRTCLSTSSPGGSPFNTPLEMPEELAREVADVRHTLSILHWRCLICALSQSGD